MAGGSEPGRGGMVRDCQHVRVRHEHGTRAAYVRDRCGCGPCTAANTAAERRRSTAIAYGTWNGLVDAAEVRAHVQSLREQGLSLKRIAQLSGVGQGTVNALVYGEPARGRPPLSQVRPDTQRRLLTVRFQAAAVPAGRRVDATGTRRRLQALATLGWSVTSLATRSDLALRTLRRALTSTTVTAETARAVTRLYDQLRAEPAPHRSRREQAAAARTKAAAQRAGWRAPLAWDDIDDDPDDPDELDEAGALEQPGSPAARVDVVAVERAMQGEQLPLTALERRDAVARLTGRGLSARCIAELLHTPVRTVTRLRGSARDAAA